MNKPVITLPPFPTMLRKMWSGSEVQQWIDENITPLLDRQERGEPVGAEHRFRHPQLTMPDWSAWQPAKIEAARASREIDSQGYEVEYRLLYVTPQPAEPNPTLPYEQALSCLIDKIIPGLDSGDILADAKTASAAVMAAEPVKYPANKIGFELWAKSHGCLPLDPWDHKANHSWFPATYRSNLTEIAWRAWANKPVTPAEPVKVPSDEEIEALAKRHIATDADKLRAALPHLPPYQQTKQFKQVKALLMEVLTHYGQPAQPATLTDFERKALGGLFGVAHAAYCAADEGEDDGSDTIKVPKASMAALNEALDALDELPDDQPGYVMEPAAKANWALRRLLTAQLAASAEPVGMLSLSGNIANYHKPESALTCNDYDVVFFKPAGELRDGMKLYAAPVAVQPINMILLCPSCGKQHIDRVNASWSNPPHRSHLCEFCGHTWRPADVCTNGVESIRTRGAGDSPIATQPSVPNKKTNLHPPGGINHHARAIYIAGWNDCRDAMLEAAPTPAADGQAQQESK